MDNVVPRFILSANVTTNVHNAFGNSIAESLDCAINDDRGVHMSFEKLNEDVEK